MMSRHSARNGHARTVAKTASTVVTSTNADDIRAKPAPGPMYARAGAALARSSHSVSERVSQEVGRRTDETAFDSL